ncbi:MAG: uroporphyrinogen decarboxylase family protein [Lentisphaerota bacterium]
MTSRERLLKVLKGEIPDCVPVAPDFSNMIPAKRTGKPFWDLYLYNDPPPWEAYIDCAKFFDIDSMLDGYFPFAFPDNTVPEHDWQTAIIRRNPEMIVTQQYYRESGKNTWHDKVNVYPVGDPPTGNVTLDKLELPPVPAKWEPLEGVKSYDRGPEGLKRAKAMLGDQGLLGVFMTSINMINNQEKLFEYYDNPEKLEAEVEKRMKEVERKFAWLMSLDVRPDFLCVGGSGSMIYQSPEFVRKYSLPAVKRAIELATAAGIPTHVHSCGPEKELVKIMAEETSLTVIDPLEIPPMGDCNLAELKRLYGKKLTLKGNLHTTEVMLKGSVQDVINASKKAIDDAKEGGRFILSTGDQCGRDTPFENIFAMVETARTYGKY